MQRTSEGGMVGQDRETYGAGGTKMEAGTIVIAVILLGILTAMKMGFNEVIKGLESIDNSLSNREVQ